MSSNESSSTPAQSEKNAGDEKTTAQSPEVEYLTGWRVGAVGIAIVLSMLLVSDPIPVCILKPTRGSDG
jgi:hypothetical protein